jgi:formamidopyrimidine-DNA glycosylase
MPELPEVETSRRGIEPHILGQTVVDVVIRQHRLRWPIPRKLPEYLNQQSINSVSRRGKYLLLTVDTGTLIIHLGMSGSLRICTPERAFDKHDHFELVFANNKILRLRDPRKFGCVLWTDKPVDQHKLLSKLGPEPLSDDFNGAQLFARSRKRNCSIKSFIMNSHMVVGVGNIYACESLFLSGINPKRKAGTVSKARCIKLADTIKQVLTASIEQGGTTLRDFSREDGQPGYFAQKLHVYGKANSDCPQCSTSIKQFTQQARSTFYCSSCQK